MRSLLLTFGCWFVVFPCLGDDFETERLNNWHQWRGPLADGIAPVCSPPVKWGAEENVKWKVEMRSIYASPVGAAGRVYFTSREGTTVVIKNQAELEVLAINTLPVGIDASPAIVGREMFLRSKRRLYCIAEE